MVLNNPIIQKLLGAILPIVLKITKKPVVLCYHRISKQKFQSHVQFLKKRFEIKPLETLLNDVYQGKKNKKLAMALTMDDCYAKEFDNAYQVCQSENTHCTYFVPTTYSEKQVSMWPLRLINFLNKLKLPATFIGIDGEEVTLNTPQDSQEYQTLWVKKLLDNKTQTTDIEKQFDAFFENNKALDDADKIIGKEVLQKLKNNPYTSFQSHTVSHPKLALQTPEQQGDEYQQSKKYLQQYVSEEQHTICYPYGSAHIIGNGHKKAKEHFKYGVTLQAGSLKKTTDPMYIPRIGIYEHDTPFRILLKVLNSQLK